MARAPKADKPAKGEKKPKKEKKEKSESDSKVKRPLSAYMYYSNSVRKEVQEENPGAKITEIAKLVGKRWALCSEADKKPFVALASADKVR